MTKLLVEVHDASNLMPKDGFASPNVEVEFNEQKQRTQTKHQDLNPYWNEKLVFDLNNSEELERKTIDVVMYKDRKGGQHHKNFLGRVKIYGASVPLSEFAATIQRYPLDKRGIFWNTIKGDIALRIYALEDSSGFYPSPPPQDGGVVEDAQTVTSQEINTNNIIQDEEEEIKVEGKEVTTSHSLGTGTDESSPAPPPPLVFRFDTLARLIL